MAGPIPVLPGTEVVKALERAGFSVVRVNGSHHVMRHADSRTVVVPVHAGRDIPKGTLRNILGIIGMSVEELSRLL